MSNKQNIVITPNLTNTSQIMYSTIFIDEFIILIRFGLAVLVARIIYQYISTYFIIPYQNNFWFTTFFTIILCSALSIIMIELITYIKLRNNRDLYLKELTNISFLSGINQ
jgi:hypothetical protein